MDGSSLAEEDSEMQPTTTRTPISNQYLSLGPHCTLSKKCTRFSFTYQVQLTKVLQLVALRIKWKDFKRVSIWSDTDLLASFGKGEEKKTGIL